MEESDIENRMGYAPPNDKGETVSYNRLGSTRRISLDKIDAKKVRTLGYNIIPEVKAVWGWKDNKQVCLRQGVPQMVAYIDEILPIYQSCTKCGKFLGMIENIFCNECESEI